MTEFQNLQSLHYPPRPENARAEVEKILRALVEDYGAEKIIVFGSTVRGGVDEHSDIDLCVIRKHPPGCTHPAWDASMAVARAESLVSKDILVRTPEQIEAARKRPFGVMDEVLNHGITVYER
jgi:predicted nucleotidyltransferase